MNPTTSVTARRPLSTALSWADWFAGLMLLPAMCLWSMAGVLPIEFLWSSQAAQQLERLMR